MLTALVVALTVVVPLVILGLALRGVLAGMPKRGQRVVGIGPFNKLVELGEQEHVLDQALAVYRHTKRTAYAGTLALLNRDWCSRLVPAAVCPSQPLHHIGLNIRMLQTGIRHLIAKLAWE